MRTRLDLHETLSGLEGVRACYFSPPEGLVMDYPCIVYHQMDETVRFADNIPYNKSKRYSITVIDEDPDSEIPDLVSSLPYCMSERVFSYDGMYHFVYLIFI